MSGIHRWPVDSPNKGSVTWKLLPFNDVIMVYSEPQRIYTRFRLCWALLCCGTSGCTGIFLNFSTDHYNDVILSRMASQITGLTIMYPTVYSGADQRKYQGSASLAFVGNSSVTGEFPTQRSSNAVNASIWWRYHAPGQQYRGSNASEATRCRSQKSTKNL